MGYEVQNLILVPVRMDFGRAIHDLLLSADYRERSAPETALWGREAVRLSSQELNKPETTSLDGRQGYITIF
jgi:hypothetical protein